MKYTFLRTITILSFCASFLLHTSCTVDQEAGFLIKAAKTGDASNKKKKKDEETSDWTKRMQEAKSKREKAAKEKDLKLALEKKKSDKQKAKEEARELAEKKKANRAKEKELAEKKKLKEQEQKQELAEKVESDREKEAKKLKARELAEKNRKEKDSKKLAAKKLAEEKRKARELASESSDSSRRSRGGGFGGFFAALSNGRNAGKYKSEGHYVYVNQTLLSSLSPANAKIEIDLSDQRVRVYKTDGSRQLVIESSVSSGKSGYGTSTGTYRIKEKLVEKRSTLYGSWKNSGGDTIPSNGEVGSRPSGASSFVGASMPYWMRINGGIGMHIGYVPNYPASHGCIRVPSAIQPLIFSKVGVGTSVTVKH